MTIQEYSVWFDDVVAPTDRMIRLVPQDKLGWKLTDTSFTMGQLIDHLHRSLAFNAEVIAGREWPLKSIREILVSNRRHPESGIEEAAARFREARAMFLKEVAAIGDERFRRDNISTPQRGTLPVWRFAAFVL